MKYTDEQLINFAHNNPEELLKIINNTHNNLKTITDAIEILSSEVDDEKLVLPILTRLLKHINVAVREGALIGVSSFFDSNRSLTSDIITKLADISINDPSPILREYAKDLLIKHQ